MLLWHTAIQQVFLENVSSLARNKSPCSEVGSSYVNRGGSNAHGDQVRKQWAVGISQVVFASSLVPQVPSR